MDVSYMELNLSCPPEYSEEEYYVKKRTIYLTNERILVYRQRIRATLFELRLLKLLTYQQFLSTKQLHRIYNYYYPIEYTTLSTKMNRWSDHGLLTTKQYFREFSYVPYHKVYQVTKRGLEVLVEEEILSPEWLDVELPKIPSRYETTRLVGEQEVIIDIFTKLNHRGVKVLSISNAFKEDNDLSGWFLESTLNGKSITNIVEFVVTKTIGKKLDYRIEKYIKLALSNPNKHFLLLVSLMDYEFPFQEYDIYDIKKKMKNAKRYFKNKSLPKNMNVIVGMSSEIGDEIKELYSDDNQLP